MCAHTQLLSPS